MMISSTRASYETKTRARRELTRALAAGRLVRPDACQDCSARPSKALHGHHEDYSKALEVVWLCSRCHGVRHRASTVRPESASASGSTIQFPRALWVKVGVLAARTGQSKRNVVIDAIRQYLDRERAA